MSNVALYSNREVGYFPKELPACGACSERNNNFHNRTLLVNWTESRCIEIEIEAH